MGETLQLPGLDARSMLPSGLYDRLAGRLEQEHGHQREKACCIVDDQPLPDVGTSERNPELPSLVQARRNAINRCGVR